MLGVGKDVLECQDLAYQYHHIRNVDEEYEKTKKYWKEQVTKVQVKTPLESMNIMLNAFEQKFDITHDFKIS